MLDLVISFCEFVVPLRHFKKARMTINTITRMRATAEHKYINQEHSCQGPVHKNRNIKLYLLYKMSCVLFTWMSVDF